MAKKRSAAAKTDCRSACKSVEWKKDGVVMIDQRCLPHRERYLTFRTAEEVAGAIRDMVIRGAPAIGIAGAMGCALGVRRIGGKEMQPFLRQAEAVFEMMESARPTAINLRWAVNRLREICYGREWEEPGALQQALVEEALRVQQEDLRINWALGVHGSGLIGPHARILTYCNTGTLATGGYGTALGVIRACWRRDRKIQVFACETRPFLQGARLTAWELMQDGIPVTLITDNAAGYLMREGGVSCAIVGADRVAANGDVANKIGTYGLAALCKLHKIPFYVAAPLSSIDLRCRSGIQIPIEFRDPAEVTSVLGKQIAPEGCKALNPAFDVTPHAFVTAVVTEKGIARPPYRESLRGLRFERPGVPGDSGPAGKPGRQAGRARNVFSRGNGQARQAPRGRET